MQIHAIPWTNIHISPDRQRRDFPPEALLRLSESIKKNGLIHPVIVRKTEKGILLIAGERRMKAMEYLWEFGEYFCCAKSPIPEGVVPCILQGEMDDLDAYEMELEENIQREDLSWQEKATATAALFELRTQQALRKGTTPPTTTSLAEEIRADMHPDAAHEATRQELIVAKHLKDTDVAGAKTTKEAFKIIKRKEEVRKSAELAISVGKTFSSADHTLLKGNCLELLTEIPDNSFDVILTDPPYGIDAQDFGDSGGMTPGAHFYDDSFETWIQLMESFAIASFRVAKPQAHAYIFCDIVNFDSLKTLFKVVGWKVFRTPFIWVNPSAMRAPWPDQGPQRKYQTILYAVKGNRLVTRLYSDVLTYTSDENLNHHAQKPVELYAELLKRSIRPGDTVLDAFGGSGPILPAAHGLKCKATYMEQNEGAFGIAVERLRSLK